MVGGGLHQEDLLHKVVLLPQGDLQQVHLQYETLCPWQVSIECVLSKEALCPWQVSIECVPSKDLSLKSLSVFFASNPKSMRTNSCRGLASRSPEKPCPLGQLIKLKSEQVRFRMVQNVEDKSCKTCLEGVPCKEDLTSQEVGPSLPSQHFEYKVSIMR